MRNTVSSVFIRTCEWHGKWMVFRWMIIYDWHDSRQLPISGSWLTNRILLLYALLTINLQYYNPITDSNIRQNSWLFLLSHLLRQKEPLSMSAFSACFSSICKLFSWAFRRFPYTFDWWNPISYTFIISFVYLEKTGAYISFFAYLFSAWFVYLSWDNSSYAKTKRQQRSGESGKSLAGKGIRAF